MNGRRAKAIRKLEKQKRMEEQKGQGLPYSFTQLENYIGLHNLLTGEKPKEVVVTEQFYTWYTQECQRHADTLGLNLGFRTETPEFAGVKIVKQVKKIEVATK